MNDTSRPLTTAAAWIGLLTSVLGGGYAVGVLANRVDNLEQQMAEQRTDAKNNATTLSDIRDQVTIVRTKLDVLLPTAVPAKEAKQ